MLDYPFSSGLFTVLMTDSIKYPPPCLTIAGSDPSGGAGIQGDLKTFAAHAVYGMAVITALTAQNTQSVSGVQSVSADFVEKQLTAIYDDIPSEFIKTGMLLNTAIVTRIADFFSRTPFRVLVVDPVMISSSGAQLLDDDAIRAYTELLFPISTLVTPNNLETRHLTGISVETVDDAISASHIIKTMGPANVLIKGGDTLFRESKTSIFDVLNFNGKIHVFEREVIGSRNSHGTGCAMAASICSLMARGVSLVNAVNEAGIYVGQALKYSYPTGQGSGSINHLWNVCSN